MKKVWNSIKIALNSPWNNEEPICELLLSKANMNTSLVSL